MAYGSFPGIIRSPSAYDLLIVGQSNADPLPLDVSWAPRFNIIRHTQASTTIAQWQKGQPIGDGLRRAYDFARRGGPLYLAQVHGESAATTDVPTAQAYAAAEDTFLTQLEADLPVVCSFIVLMNSGMTAYPFREEVRTSQLAAVALNSSKRRAVDPNADTLHDNNHYTNPAGYQLLGSILTTAMRLVVP